LIDEAQNVPGQDNRRQDRLPGDGCNRIKDGRRRRRSESQDEANEETR